MLKQTLLTFTVLGLAGSAAAADITNPFFLPESLHVASVTTGSFAETARKDGGASERIYTKAATEQLAFGIVNNLAVIGSIGKDWNKWKDRTLGISAKDHNDLDWNAGLAWNILSCGTKLQLSSVYGQDDPGVKGTYKYFDTEVKLGYQFKTFLPYVTFNVHTPVAQTKEWRTNKWSYDGKVGLYQGKCEVWSLDTGLVMNFDRTDHSRYLTAEAEASYYLTKNMTLGVYGSYLLDGKEKGDPDVYNKTVGARLRLYF